MGSDPGEGAAQGARQASGRVRTAVEPFLFRGERAAGVGIGPVDILHSLRRAGDDEYTEIGVAPEEVEMIPAGDGGGIDASAFDGGEGGSA